MSELQQKTVTGIVWSLLERFGIYFIKFIMGVVLARLLTPADFGLIGMITVFFAVAEVFVNSGFGMAYVQKKQVYNVDADTVFYTNLLFSLILFIAIFFCAPMIARFFNQPQLLELTRVMAFVIIINAFNIIQRAMITRAVDFKKLTSITLFATLLSGTIGISMAYYGKGVWALVIQSISSRIFVTIGFWIKSDYKPGCNFSIQAFKEMFSFGSWILITNLIGRLFDNIYILAIGKFFPIAQLGFYTKAKQFRDMLSQNIAGAIGSVAFPVYSKMQNDKARLLSGMRKFLQHSLIFIVPLLVGLIVVAKPFIILLLTEKWAPMIPYLQLLCIAGLLYPIHIVNVQSLTAQGKARLSFKLDLLKNGLRIANIIIMYRYGVLYIIIGEIVLSFFSLIINTYYIKRLLDYGLWEQIRDVWKIFAGGLIAGLAASTSVLVWSNLWVLLFTGIFITSITYLGFQYLFNQAVLLNTIALKNSFSK
jgi:O-antigen/teichoic acid export membrane protein